MTNLTSIIRSKTYVKNDVVTPLFFRLSNASDREGLEELLVNEPRIVVFDEIKGQLEELVKLRNPSKKFTPEEIEEGIRTHLGTTSLEEYGVWVFYPWNSTLVHILDEDEFVESRTNRNMYKITPKERDILSGKKIGVVGLSVGSSVALIFALERLCGELRLIDFDSLELTNLNRIDASLQDLGMDKTMKVARKIRELDPFLELGIWGEGATKENLDDIIAGKGKLDMIIDECDSLDIKVQLRKKAKEHGIPVLMSTSDAGILDVERFDQEPERSVFHGYLDHLDLSLVEGLITNESKIPYILPILQPRTMSSRLKASMIEVGQSISTWPQLASDVYAGAGALVGTARQILIGNKVASGRYYIDWNEVVLQKGKPQLKKESSFLDAEKARELVNKFAIPELPNAFTLGEDILTSIVQAGTQAPSGGNCQPWFWYAKGSNLFLLHDSGRSDGLLDFQNRGSYLAFGAAAENVSLKAHSLGLTSKIRWVDNNENSRIAAVFSFAEQQEKDKPEDLYKGIELRQTNRNIEARVEIDEMILSSLETDSIQIVSDLNSIKKVGELSAACERIRIMHKIGHFDFINEMRWTAEEARRTGDGVDIETVDLTPSELAGMEVARDPNTMIELRALGEDHGQKFEELTNKTFCSASSLALIIGPDDELSNYSEAGRKMQRFWLECNLMGLAIHPVSAPLFLYYRSVREEGSFSPYQKKILQNYFDAVNEVFGLNGKKPLFLVKMAKAEMAKKSERRSLESVFAKDDLLLSKSVTIGS